MSFPTPVFSVAGSTDPAAPLVVLCHGIGEDETMFDHVVPHLPSEVAVVQMRGPVPAGRGFNWFQRERGRIVPDSIAEVTEWFETWIDGYAAPGRPVVVMGFSAGSAFAGLLALRRPERYAGVGVLSGALPLSHFPEIAAAGRLTGVPLFLAVSAQDTIIREEYTRETWRYLTESSGAVVTTRVDPGEHEVTVETADAIGAWLRGLRVEQAAEARGSASA